MTGFVFLPNVSAATTEPNLGGEAYNGANPYAAGFSGQCTWYAWGRTYELTGIAVPMIHDANSWYYEAIENGFTVSDTPRENSVVVWGASADNGNFGHVAFVEAYDGTNVTISQANYGWTEAYNGRMTKTPAELNSMGCGTVLGYIYMGDDPSPRDTEAPTISDVKVTKNKTGYTVTCTVSDNVGVTRVEFPTWVVGKTEADWAEGTINGNQASYTVLYDKYAGAEGNYVTDIYAYDAAGNRSGAVSGANIKVDVVDPKITSAEITNITGHGYTVRVVASDNVGVSKVKFSTWTTAGGKDDVVNVEQNGSSKNTYTYEVNIKDHANEGGIYNTKVTVYDEYGNSSVVDLSESIFPIVKVTLNETSANIYKGQILNLVASYLPENTTGDTTVIWKSSNPEVAKVEDGKVIALKEGKATITATIDGVKESCVVTVKEIPLDSIQIDQVNVRLFVGDSKKLNVLFNPLDTTDDKDVIWSSSDESIVSISEDGTITAKKVGTVTITAKVGDKVTTTEVTVDESILPKTGDINIMPIIMGVIVSVGGIIFMIKKRFC